MADDPRRLPPPDRGGEAAAGQPLPPGEDRPLLVLDSAAPGVAAKAADRFNAGAVVAFPTDTVYALAASLVRPDALDRLFAVKGRPADKPLPVLLAGPADLARIALDRDERVTALVAHYWPGPLTVVVPARRGLPARVVGPGHTVGARVPNHPLALEIVARAGGALAATSANRSGAPPARTAREVAAELGRDLDLLVDGGPTPGGVPSTVVRVADGSPVVIREGAIPGERLLAAWDEIVAAADLR